MARGGNPRGLPPFLLRQSGTQPRLYSKRGLQCDWLVYLANNASSTKCFFRIYTAPLIFSLWEKSSGRMMNTCVPEPDTLLMSIPYSSP